MGSDSLSPLGTADEMDTLVDELAALHRAARTRMDEIATARAWHRAAALTERVRELEARASA